MIEVSERNTLIGGAGLYILSVLLDILTTVQGVSKPGVHEANSFSAAVISIFGPWSGIVLVKLLPAIVLVLGYVALEVLLPKDSVSWLFFWFLFIGSVYNLLIVLNNLWVLGIL
jgi:hypothetical protein